MGAYWKDVTTKLINEQNAREQSAFDKNLGLYRSAAEKAAYAGFGPQFDQGYGQINGALSRGGPLTDSGARNAMQTRLAGNIFGRANQQVLQGVQGFAGDWLQNRQRFKDQLALLKYQKSLQPSAFGSFAGHALGAGVGFLAGGPAGAAAGYGYGGGMDKGGYA